jgi:AcrR family transcriptional regulator
MPKLVDHDARREELAAALWRLVMRDGIEAASIRRVAAEAGWSSGSLRHYFETQSDLLAFAMELVTRRAEERVAAIADPPSPRAWAERALEQVLPLDDERRAEMQVWLAFSMRAAVDPALRPLRDASHEALRQMCQGIAELLGSGEALRDGERLHALVDGLALHGVLTPDVTTPARQLELLAGELDALERG